MIAVALAPMSVSADDGDAKIETTSIGSKEDVKGKLPHEEGTIADEGGLKNVVNVFLYIGGLVAVIMGIVAGVQMTTSAGDPATVAKAKKTLSWSIIGLLVMILAYAIVNFVIGRVTGSSDGGGFGCEYIVRILG